MTAVVALALLCAGAENPKPAPPATPKEALQPFNVLVGSWKGSGAPEGTKEERVAGGWEETVVGGWNFEDQDAWLAVPVAEVRRFWARRP